MMTISELKPSEAAISFSDTQHAIQRRQLSNSPSSILLFKEKRSLTQIHTIALDNYSNPEEERRKKYLNTSMNSIMIFFWGGVKGLVSTFYTCMRLFARPTY
jgi:hypothetical protein